MSTFSKSTFLRNGRPFHVTDTSGMPNGGVLRATLERQRYFWRLDALHCAGSASCLHRQSANVAAYAGGRRAPELHSGKRWLPGSISRCQPTRRALTAVAVGKARYDTVPGAEEEASIHPRQQASQAQGSWLSSIRSFLPGGSWWDLGPNSGSNDPDSGWQVVQRVFGLVKDDKATVAFAFLFLTLAAFAELSIPHFISKSIFAASKGQASNFHYNAVGLLAATVGYGVFSGFRGAAFAIANQSMVRRMRERLYSNLVNQEMAFFDLEGVGDLTSRLGSDCQAVAHILGVNINIMLRNMLQLLGGVVYLSTLSRLLAVQTAGICAAIWAVMAFTGRFQRQAARVVQDNVAAANDVAEETFSLAKVVRTFGTEEHELGRYKRWAQAIVEVSMRQSVAYGLSTGTSNTLYYAMQVVALFVSGSSLMQGRTTAEMLTTVVLYVESVVNSCWVMGDQWTQLMEAIGASDKVFQLMDLPPDSQLVDGGRTLSGLKGQIEFREVGFRYPSRPLVRVVDGISLEIQSGELIAVVGLSGSGKSTLVGLLQRHYDPTEGAILVDGVPLQELDARWFRSQLGVVSQDPRLFTTTIAENIAYGAPSSVTPADIERAACVANAHDFIMALPLGYETPVRDGRLSGGQRQRIAIARALIRDPHILILDEATSALDAESERLVKAAMDRVMRGEDGGRRRTTIVIAHRLSTVRNADRIVVMKGGHIAEVGTHEELLAKDGEYAKLTRRQIGNI